MSAREKYWIMKKNILLIWKIMNLSDFKITFKDSKRLWPKKCKNIVKKNLVFKNLSRIELSNKRKGVDGVYNKLQSKVEALEAFVECYGDNLGLVFEKSKDGNFLIMFEEISRVAPNEKHIIEMKYEEETDRFLSKE